MLESEAEALKIVEAYQKSSRYAHIIGPLTMSSFVLPK